jgi:hypothetical protein
MRLLKNGHVITKEASRSAGPSLIFRIFFYYFTKVLGKLDSDSAKTLKKKVSSSYTHG